MISGRTSGNPGSSAETMNTKLFTSTLALGVAISAPFALAAGAEKESGAPKQDYSFRSGAPAAEKAPQVRRELGGQDIQYGMSTTVGEATEVVEASNALAEEHRRLEAEALKTNTVYLARNADKKTNHGERETS